MSMKINLLRATMLFVVASLGLFFGGCSEKGSGQEKLTEDQRNSGLILRADIPDDKWQKILEVLNGQTVTPDAYPRAKLFRIRKYVPGQPPVADPQEGALDDEMLHEDFDTVPPDFKGHAIQIGLGYKPDFHRYPADVQGVPSPAPHPPGDPEPSPPFSPQTHFKNNLKESKIMVEKVDDILNGTPTPSPTP